MHSKPPLARALAMSTIVVAAGGRVSTVHSPEKRNETVLVHVATGKYYSLNRAGSFVWEQLKKPVSLGQIVDVMVTKFDVDRPRCEADVRDIIASLLDAGLVQARP
ncbi:MAG: PqqD family protein [Myxococcales bacterium]